MSDAAGNFPSEFTELCRQMKTETMVVYDAGYRIERLSYAEVFTHCRRCIALFNQHHLKCGDTVVTIMPNSPEAVLCFFSALLAGINYAPLPCSVTKREFHNWISIVKPQLILKKRGIADYETEVPVIDCDCDGELSWISQDECGPLPKGKPSQVYLMTSGTTGDPKAMSLNSERLWQSGKAFCKFYHMENSGVRFWNYLPMSYLGGLFNLALIPLCCKGSFVISEPFSGKTILNYWNFVKKHKITALWFVPSIVQGLLKLSSLVGKNAYGHVCQNIKIAFLGTAPIAFRHKMEFEERFHIRLYENFALSETTFLTAENNEDIRFRERGSVGVPLPYISMKIVPIEDAGGTGAIWVKTPYLFSGYLSEDGAVEMETDPDGYFNTKDLGHYNDDGVLVLDGRDRDIIKRGGLFVSLAEIENVIKDYPDIEDAAAVAIDHDFYGESFFLFVKLRPGCIKEKCVKEIHIWMLDNFVSYKIPEKIIPMDDFPKTSSGKIQKKKLLAMSEEKQ